MQPGAFHAHQVDGGDDGHPQVILRGELDLTTVNEAEEVLLKTVASATKGEVTVDVTLLTFIDGSGARALIAAHSAAQASGRRIRIVGAQGLVATVLSILELIDRDPRCAGTPAARIDRASGQVAAGAESGESSPPALKPSCPTSSG